LFLLVGAVLSIVASIRGHREDKEKETPDDQETGEEPMIEETETGKDPENPKTESAGETDIPE
jgi:hypothetical protein